VRAALPRYAATAHPTRRSHRRSVARAQAASSASSSGAHAQRARTAYREASRAERPAARRIARSTSSAGMGAGYTGPGRRGASKRDRDRSAPGRSTARAGRFLAAEVARARLARRDRVSRCTGRGYGSGRSAIARPARSCGATRRGSPEARPRASELRRWDARAVGGAALPLTALPLPAAPREAALEDCCGDLARRALLPDRLALEPIPHGRRDEHGHAHQLPARMPGLPPRGGAPSLPFRCHSITVAFALCWRPLVRIGVPQCR